METVKKVDVGGTITVPERTQQPAEIAALLEPWHGLWRFSSQRQKTRRASKPLSLWGWAPIPVKLAGFLLSFCVICILKALNPTWSGSVWRCHAVIQGSLLNEVVCTQCTPLWEPLLLQGVDLSLAGGEGAGGRGDGCPWVQYFGLCKMWLQRESIPFSHS